MSLKDQIEALDHSDAAAMREFAQAQFGETIHNRTSAENTLKRLYELAEQKEAEKGQDNDAKDDSAQGEGSKDEEQQPTAGENEQASTETPPAANPPPENPPAAGPPPAEAPAKPRHLLRNTRNGRVVGYTKELAKRPHMQLVEE